MPHAIGAQNCFMQWTLSIAWWSIHANKPPRLFNDNLLSAVLVVRWITDEKIEHTGTTLLGGLPAAISAHRLGWRWGKLGGWERRLLPCLPC